MGDDLRDVSLHTCPSEMGEGCAVLHKLSAYACYVTHLQPREDFRRMVLIPRIFKTLKRGGPNAISLTSKLSFYALSILLNFILIASSSPTCIQYLLSIHAHGCICTFDLNCTL